MHDGQNLFNDSTAFGGVAWRCQDTIDSLVNQGQIDEIVIIGIDNTPNRTYELTYSFDPSEGAGGSGDLYLNFIEDTVLPYVTPKFRGSDTMRGILGSSLGGLISCYAGWTRNTYTVAGCMSSSFWWNSEDFTNIVMSNPPAGNRTDLYLDSGDSGPGNDDELQTLKVLKHMTATYNFTIGENVFYYLDKGGQHNEKYWGARFWVPMMYLFSPQNWTCC